MELIRKNPQERGGGMGIEGVNRNSRRNRSGNCQGM